MFVEWNVREGKRPELSQHTNAIAEENQIIHTLIETMHQAWSQEPKL
jgi:hypothetical protein